MDSLHVTEFELNVIGVLDGRPVEPLHYFHDVQLGFSRDPIVVNLSASLFDVILFTA